MFASLRVRAANGKLDASQGQETRLGDAMSPRLIVVDRSKGARFLVDTGADVSILPRSMVKRKSSLDKHKLYAANNTLINTYGTELVSVDLGIRRKMEWAFVIADVKQAIIGADFLEHYGLLVDLRHKTLQDEAMKIQVSGEVVDQEIEEIITFDTAHSPIY